MKRTIINKYNSDAVARFITANGVNGKVKFDINDKTFESLDTILEKSLLKNAKTIENILNLPDERRNELVHLLVKNKGIDVDLASNPNLSEAQYQQHVLVAKYNYNVEYQNLKDSGRDVIDKNLIADPNLTPEQISLIHIATVNNTVYLPTHFNQDGKILPKEEILAKMEEQRVNAVEVKSALLEVGTSPAELNRQDIKYLNDLHLSSKDNLEQAQVFNNIINNPNIKETIQINKLNPELNKLLNSIDAEKSADDVVIDFSKIPVDQAVELKHKQDEIVLKPSDPEVLPKLPDAELIDLLKKEHNVEFIEVSDDNGNKYYESANKDVQIKTEEVALNNISPESVALALSATVAKFGNDIIIDGSDEFKNMVVEAIAQNPKFANVNILNPELQEQIAEAKKIYNQENNIVANTLKGVGAVEITQETVPPINQPQNTPNQKNNIEPNAEPVEITQATQPTIPQQVQQVQHSDNKSELIQAIINKEEIAKIEALIKNGADLEYRNAEGETALTKAIAQNNHLITRALLDNGAEVNYTVNQTSKNTPLHIAAIHGSTEIVADLLNKGADKEVTNSNNKTPLQEAENAKAKSAELLSDVSRILPSKFLKDNDKAEVYTTKEEALSTTDKPFLAKVEDKYIAFKSREELIASMIQDKEHCVVMSSSLAENYYNAQLEQFADQFAKEFKVEIGDVEEVSELKNEKEQEHEHE